MSWADRPAARRVVAATAAAAVGVVVAAGGAGAAETYPRPADGTLTIVGHGNGHGHGMSQYGALGAGLAGRTWQQIVGFYYPGTTVGSMGNPTIRVNVASLGSSVQAVPATGLRVTWDLTNSSVLPTERAGRTIARWRLVPGTKVSGVKTKFRLEYLPTGSATWLSYATASVPSTGAFLNSTSGVVTTYRGSTQVQYRGQVRGILSGPAGAESLVPVVALPMDSYLRTVVPSEVPASWPAATLGAQAAAARSFAEWHRTNAPVSTWYDVYDDTRSQVFKPAKTGSTSNEYTATNTAIAATAGMAVLYGGKAAFTQFSASDGGWSSDGGKPYLVAQRDDYDDTPSNPYHTWTQTISTSTIESSYPTIGSFRTMTITSRNGLGDQGGRVLGATITGTKGSVSPSVSSLRSVFGHTWSDWFAPRLESASSFPRDVTGDAKMDVLAVVASTGALRVYSGNGKGGWNPTTVAEPSGWNSYAKALTAGTWDADTVSDVVVQDTAGNLYLRSGLGNGTFGAAKKIGAGWTMHNLVLPVGDFDGDGLTDLIARRASDGALWLYSGNGAGGFKGYRTIGGGWNIFTSVLSPGDFTGDGHPDVLARKADGTFLLYAGDGTGGWKPAVQVGKGWDIFTALTSGGDFNGDGKADVLARTSSGLLYLYPGNGAGGWKPRVVVGNGWQIFSTILR
ncbi:SpoIID/LytB domain protein [Pedococcus dokdonensis]|uniref:SpoIID/LytB domain protein n=1 Tax=Pedococcus dokdonensis TaxID=443156 RepID=A0A1H0RFW1_9MICO|nr:SpoIID/LytB domain-containing protein [Pedococcus dokdonensis]SDP28453.1 SpoIID/LytB domain protein [Pedococcus dokdonensis]